MAGSLVVAAYDFTKEADGDLSFSKGDYIKIIKEVSNEWLHGVCNGVTGQFPSVFVKEVLKHCPERICVASDPYISHEDGDLSFGIGQLITILSIVDENWLEGECNGKKGIFPKKFIKEINLSHTEEIVNGGKETRCSKIPEPHGTANNDFTAQSPEELSFSKGKHIVLKREIDGFWIEGEINGKTGKFPSMFIDIIVQLPDELRYHEEDVAADDVSLQPHAKALFMYVGVTEKDLSFDKGDIIVLKKKVSKEWLCGQIGKHEGIFPKNYVEIIRDLPFDPNEVLEEETLQPEKVILDKTTSSKPTLHTSLSVEKRGSVEKRERSFSDVDKPPLQIRPKTLSFRKSKKKKSVSKSALPEKVVSPISPKSNGTIPTSDTSPLIAKKSVAPTKPIPQTVVRPPRKKRQAPRRPSTTPIMKSSQSNNNDLLDSVDKTSSSKLLKPLAPDPRQRVPSLSKSLSSQSIQRGSVDHIADMSSDKDATSASSSPGLRRHNTLPVNKFKAPPRGVHSPSDDTLTKVNGSPPKSPLLQDAASSDDKINSVISQIEHQHERLNDIESLIKMVEDKSKLKDLEVKRDSYIAVIDNLQDNLSSLEDERSHTLLNTSSEDGISSRIADIESQIEMHESNKRSLQKMIAEADDEKEKKELQDNIGFCLVMIEGLNDEMKELSELISDKESASPVKTIDAQSKMLINRLKVVKELLHTEQSYVTDLKLCSTKVYNYLKESKIELIKVDVIFGTLPVLCNNVAKRFLDSLSAVLVDIENPDIEAIASLFLKELPTMKQRYAEYCRNYDDAQAFLEKYEDQVEVMEELANAVDTVRNDTQCWDLSSFLIKPVQRILKYPLMLQEILKSTPADFPERDRLREAVMLSFDVAKEINEVKRRKDLVLKYQRAEGIGNKIQKLNWHSVRKKSSRINQKITRFTGLSHTIDENFNEEERKIRNLDRTLKLTLKNITSYLETFQEQCNLQKTLAEDIREFYMDQANSEEVDAYHYVFLKLNEVTALHFFDHVQSKFVEPLNQLTNLLQSPFRLIQKRHDKLLDFDYHLKRAEKIKDKDKIGVAKEELLVARNNYEAMNSQLLEELPALVERGWTLIHHCLIHVVKGHRTYLKQACELMEPLLQLRIMSPGRDDIIGQSRSLLHQMQSQLANLAFFPDSKEKRRSIQSSSYSKTSFYVDYTLMDSNQLNDPTSPMKPHARWLDDGKSSNNSSPKSSPSSPTRGTDTKRKESRTERKKNLDSCEVMYDFEAVNEHEVTLEQGEIVIILSRADKKGNSDWWLVEAKNGLSGYVPKTYLDSSSPEVERSSSESSLLSPRSDNDYRIVEYDFEADNPGEIELKEADIVKVIAKADLQGNTEWWLVEIDDRQGYIPASYLATIDEIADM